jgi:hypothetical protein
MCCQSVGLLDIAMSLRFSDLFSIIECLARTAEIYSFRPSWDLPFSGKLGMDLFSGN